MLMKFSKSQNKGDIEKLPTFFLPNWQKFPNFANFRFQKNG